MGPFGHRWKPATQTCSSMCSKSFRHRCRFYANRDQKLRKTIKSLRYPSKVTSNYAWLCHVMHLLCSFSDAENVQTRTHIRYKSITLNIFKLQMPLLIIIAGKTIKKPLFSQFAFIFDDQTTTDPNYAVVFASYPSRKSFQTLCLVFFLLEQATIHGAQERIQIFEFFPHEFVKFLQNVTLWR